MKGLILMIKQRWMTFRRQVVAGDGVCPPRARGEAFTRLAQPAAPEREARWGRWGDQGGPSPAGLPSR